ncbi:MAG: hypothetical protein ACXVA9_12290 [Bdellovibrionales bacterium]
MKLLIAALILFSTSAFACPDVSGTYVSAEGTHIKYVQIACVSLTRYLGDVAQDGSVSFPEPGTVFVLDGKPLCGIHSTCTTATALADGIEFKLNFNGGVATDTHGSCNQNGYILNKDTGGNLLANFMVYNCTDKFAGTALKTFKKFPVAAIQDHQGRCNDETLGNCYERDGNCVCAY